MKKAVFTIEKVANMVFIVSDCGTIWKTWHENEFTQRKLNNAKKRIQKGHQDYQIQVEFINKLEA